jgi:hypothetical protein
VRRFAIADVTRFAARETTMQTKPPALPPDRDRYGGGQRNHASHAAPPTPALLVIAVLYAPPNKVEVCISADAAVRTQIPCS